MKNRALCPKHHSPKRPLIIRKVKFITVPASETVISSRFVFCRSGGEEHKLLINIRESADRALFLINRTLDCDLVRSSGFNPWTAERNSQTHHYCISMKRTNLDSSYSRDSKYIVICKLHKKYKKLAFVLLVFLTKIIHFVRN